MLGNGEVQDAVVGGVLVGRSAQRALGAGAVVTIDVDDQRIVELAHVLDLLDDAADLVVGVGCVAGEHLGLPGEQLLLVGRQCIPLRQVIRPVSQLCTRGNDPQSLLVGEDLLAQGIPAHVEFALELVDPLLLGLVR